MPGKTISRKILYALISSAEYLQRTAYSEQEILQGFKKQLEKFGLRGGICILDPERNRLTMDHFTAIVMPHLQKKEGAAPNALSFDWKKIPVFKQCIEDQENFYLEKTNPFVAEAFPAKVRDSVREILQRIPDVPGIVCPIVIEGTTLGILMIGNKAISRDDLPLIVSFSNQLATALQNSRLFSKIIQAEAQYRDLVENVNEVIFTVNTGGTLTYISPRVKTMLGYEVSDVVGRPFHQFIHPGDLQEIVSQFNKVLRGELEPSEYRIISKEGGVRWVRSSSRPIMAGGASMGIRGVLIDISERKQTEELLKRNSEELERKNAELLARNKELDEFTYIASHDLQEPLNKIAAFSGFLRKDLGGSLPEAAEKDYDYIQNAVRRMRLLIQDLLLLSRTGKAALKIGPVDLETLAGKVLDTFSDRLSQARAAVTRDALPRVDGDPTLLSQLYQNLVSNAIKFRKEAPLQIHFSAERKGGEWVLGVRDNGIGIAPEFFQKIFIPFQRLHARQEFEGTGIGLSICKKVIERHGGTLWVESNPGAGAHFKFTLKA